MDPISILAEACAESIHSATDESRSLTSFDKNDIEREEDLEEDDIDGDGDGNGDTESWQDADIGSPTPSNGFAGSTPSGKTTSRGSWTAEEDEKLKQAVSEYGGRNWKKIAEQISDRTDVQCLHRWQKVLRPGLIKGPWTAEVWIQVVLIAIEVF